MRRSERHMYRKTRVQTPQQPRSQSQVKQHRKGVMWRAQRPVGWYQTAVRRLRGRRIKTGEGRIKRHHPCKGGKERGGQCTRAREAGRGREKEKRKRRECMVVARARDGSL
ncbi:predicted protein [Coccidioides posadasii str. Silveira]|uniref:Predicted protein n=1 Tax=Coccidioides posadasii (strain RMSCC 757 / Silveira) TaxID=443226 RepID=E9CTF4_COCPS|nr:predicted protein [Coccidioides posadasii str. Silveira]